MSRSLLAIGIALLVLSAGCAGVLGQSGPTLEFDSTGDHGFGYEAGKSRTMNSGAGVYVSDYDSDGWPDLLALGGTPNGSDHQRPVLYHNTHGSFELSGALPQDALAGRTYVGALFFDQDTDGDDDLLLLAVNAEPVFLANQDGEFVQRNLGLSQELAIPLGAAAGDYDGDGRPDLVIFQNGDWQNNTPAGYRQAGDVDDDNGNPNYLYHWNGTGYERVGGAFSGARWTLGASFVDLTEDGRPDVHFTNDYNNDVVYVNQGNSEFRPVVPGNATNRNGMASEVADFNRDGLPDIFVTNIYFNRSKVTSEYTTNYLENVLGKRAEGNNLLINGPGAEFTDQAPAYGVVRGGWGWAAVAGDLDNDGDTDLIHATQEFTDTFLRQSFKTDDVPSYYQYPAVWERTDDGFTQRDASTLGFEKSNTRGMARLDFDRDGDLDLVAAQWSQGEYTLYENTGAAGNWLELALQRDSGTALGATVTVTAGDRTWTRFHTSRADYQSQDSRTIHVGLGKHETIDRVTITWPDGSTTTLTDVQPNARLVVGPDGIRNRTHEE